MNKIFHLIDEKKKKNFIENTILLEDENLFENNLVDIGLCEFI